MDVFMGVVIMLCYVCNYGCGHYALFMYVTMGVVIMLKCMSTKVL